MRAVFVVALILIALSPYRWFVRPADEADLAQVGASETSLILPGAGTPDCVAPSARNGVDQPLVCGTD